ncbi:Tetratricopeptide repeat protein 37 [Toxocara canis]|uniref:Tetratricopeptide repeat protein 37 n=1 Tax=Toxocara canis TaxID=6265 RepID=A0A0B2W4X8_TOXCA|nr:Tetratricopeptide repeat protein 37 [Toxocara canis]
MERKQILKSIRQHIDAEENDKAESLIQDLLEQGVSDYLLYLFTAVIRSKKGDVESAVQFYKKAIAIDENKVAAWQGLAKLYETGQIPADDFVLDVLDKLIILYKESPDKRQSYMGMRDGALLSSQNYEIILQEEHFANDIELCKRIVRTLVMPKHVYSDVEYALCEKCIGKMEAEAQLDSELASKCAMFRASFATSFVELRDLLVDEASRCGGSGVQGWIMESLRCIQAVTLLCSREVDMTVCDLLLASPERHFFETLLELIRDKKFEAALDLLLTLSDHQLTWPLCGPAIVVWLKQEQYERVLKLVDEALLFEKDAAVERAAREGLLTVKAEALDGISDQPSRLALHQLLESEHFDNQIWIFLHISMIADSDCTDEEFLEALNKAHVAEDERCYWLALLAANRNRLTEAKENAEKALGRVADSWRLMLLLAEILIRIDRNDLNATALLLKAVKLNGPSSRIYYRLAENLADRSASKALGCLEMATRMRPQHLEVAQLRDKLLGLEGRKREQLSNIEHFLAVQPRSVWALKRLALLKLQLDMTDEAVEDLQAALRLARDDLILLSVLGVAYRKRGNFESAIKTYKAVLELSPEDTNVRMQLAQVYRSCSQLDEALEQCEMLHQCAHTTQYMVVLHTDVLMRMAYRETSPSKRISLLNRLFELINTTPEGGQNSLAFLKIIADSLMLVAKFGEETLVKFIFPKAWPIGSRNDVLKIAVDAYFAITKLHPSAESWNDLGLAFLLRSRLSGDKRMAERAAVSFEHALAMSKCKQTQSVLWANMAQAVLLAGSPVSSLHCAKAAILLNANNALAWSMLALLLITLSKYESSQRALDMAMKDDAKTAETWSLQYESSQRALDMAMKDDAKTAETWSLQERAKHPSAIDLFEQSISVKPTKLAVERFTFHAMRALHSGSLIKNVNMFNFDAVHDFVEMGNTDDELFFFTALLAEYMGCFTIALRYMDMCDSFPNDHLYNIHRQRIAVRTQSGEIDGCVESLRNLAHLYSLKTDQLYGELLACSTDYSEHFDVLSKGDTERMRALLAQNNCDISSVLLVSALICFRKSVSNGMVKVVRHMCPKHPLLGLYPPGSTADADDEFSYDVGKKSDALSSYHNNFSEQLCRLLQSRREFAESATESRELNVESDHEN